MTRAAIDLTHELGCGYLAIHAGDSLEGLAAERLRSVTPYVHSVAPLPENPDALWKWPSIKPEVRNDVRRAKKLGVSVSLSASEDGLAQFYDLLIETSRKHGMPPQPYRFFRTMWQVLKPGKHLQLFLATRDARPIFGAIGFPFKDALILSHVGTDYASLDFHAAKLTYWSMMEWASSQGYRKFDMLRSPIENEGLRWFKRSLGAVETPLIYYYHPAPRGAAVGWRASPELTRLLGGVLNRLPKRVLGVIGQVAYRHVA
jgi:lipid II:glycine glycyltransferase (peptidoglycan interpeptide bridge formation enzyme)